MSGTTTPTCFVDQLGIHAPSYDDVLTYLQNQYRAIYGQDTYLGNDSQDGQLLGVFALCLHDANSMAVMVYNAFSPVTAQGRGLSSVVKINGIRRLLATNSVVDLVLVGQAGREIINGVVRDTNQNDWLLPTTVVIPPSGEITVTAVAENSGAIEAAPGTVTFIATPMPGWQSATNVLAAEAGDALESDSVLRRRQTSSTALPSQAILDGIVGSLLDVRGVTRLAAYENDTPITDANGLPPHSLAFVVDGGDATSIARAIMTKKTPGTGTYGTTSQDVSDAFGVVHTIRFFRPVLVPISVQITVSPLLGFTTTTELTIRQAIVDYINALSIGDDVLLTKLYTPANLSGAVNTTFNIVGLAIARSGSPAPQDITIAFNEAAACSVDNVQLTAIVNP